jgi:16S rRNA (cytosine967-C5)-methyltransferase
MMNDARFLAHQILNQYKSKTKLDKVIEKVFTKYNPDYLARSRCRVIVYDVIRLLGRIDFIIKIVSGKNHKQIPVPIQSILRIGFYEILIDEHTPDYAAVDSAVNLAKSISNKKSAGFINAVLRKLVRKKNNRLDWLDSLSNHSEWNSMPDWIQSRWKKNLGSEGFIKMIKSVNDNPPNFIRIQQKESNLEQIIEELSNDGINTEIFSESFLIVKGGTGKVLQTQMFKNGEISIQNPASAAVVDCLNVSKGDFVIDVCAAPGTKSLYLSSLVGDSGKVLASDVIRERVEMGKRDVDRHGKLNIKWEVKDATKDNYPMADYMLIDAPCTGTGVLARKPDIKWRRKKSDILELSKKQFDILSHCSKFVNTNGIIVYATCSIEPEENWNVVDRFLNFNPKFKLDNVYSMVPKSWIDERGAMSTLPYLNKVDGMFAARIKKE